MGRGTFNHGNCKRGDKMKRMLFSIEEHAVEAHCWSEASSMLRNLDECSTGKLILNSEPMEGRFAAYSIVVHSNYSASRAASFKESPGSKLGIGLFAEDLGIPPALAFLPPTTVVLGFGNEIAGIRFDKGEICFRYKFDTPFHSFLKLEDRDGLLMFNEIGVISIDAAGTELWRYEDDVLEDCVVSETELRLIFMDSPAATIDLDSGIVTLRK